MQKLASGTENSRDFILDMILAHVLRVIPGNCSLFSEHARQFTKMAPNHKVRLVCLVMLSVSGAELFSVVSFYTTVLEILIVLRGAWEVACGPGVGSVGSTAI